MIAKDGHRYDRFRSRVMYPIRNPRGQVIGFGARTMVPGEEPKYLNSPETPVYHKSQELYGLYEARDAIHKKGRAIVCEGYMDVIQMSQGGFLETVAALGTSITPEHVKNCFSSPIMFISHLTEMRLVLRLLEGRWSRLCPSSLIPKLLILCFCRRMKIRTV